MSLNNFIPAVWAGKILAALQKDLVYGQSSVVNKDYEGEINGVGDTVKINSIGDVTISTYTKNTNISAPQELSDAQQQLVITEAKYFNFAIDDIDAVQTKPKVMGEASSRAGYGMADVADQFIAAKYTDVPSANQIGSDASAKVPSANTAGTSFYEYLVDLGVILSENNIPKTGRFAVIPPWCHGLLQKDERFVKVGNLPAETRLINGMIGRAAGLDIYESNNVPNTAGALYKIIAGHPMALSYAEQITKVEAYRPELRFSDALKGLHVYGAKLVRPYAWALLTASKT